MIPHRHRNLILANMPGTGHRLIFLVLKNSLAQYKRFISEAQNTMKTSMNYPFDRGYLTKSITKYKQKILECE